MAKKESADQKLLKMMEAASTSTEKPQPAAPVRTKKKQDPLSALRYINYGLMVAIVVSIVFLVKEIQTGLKLEESPIKLAAESNGSKKGNKDFLNFDVPDFNDILKVVSGRNFFESYEEKVVEDTPTRKVESVEQIVKQTEKLRLVGISWLDRVETASVMIEDLETGKTYVKQKGDVIENKGITINKIYADGVELGYKNEEITIGYDQKRFK